KPSAIREIFKYAADPSVVSLSAGNPAPEAFPTQKVAQITADILRDQPIDALQYSVTEGYPALRRCVGDYMRQKHQVGRAFDDVLITAGAQQALELLAKTVLNRGDVVLCEEPSFVGALNAFRALGAKLVGVPMQEDGIDTDALEQAMRQNPNARFLYTIPNFQNPTGITMSWEKRVKVYELAKKYGILIAEDNPYADLRFAGEHIPAIKTLDEEGIVVYDGSFSKVLAPGLRVGYAIAPKELLAKMVVCKQGEDVHTAILPQMLCERFMNDPGYEEHLLFLQSLYRRKAGLMADLIEQHLTPCGITYHAIQGGLFFWCRLPDGVDMRAFCTAAVRDHKVAVVPGNAFLTDDKAPCQSFRINFSTPTDEAMRIGMERLGRFAREYITKG
ncbi:MAG: PLP-dependent aminotransferase family protein, partial [Clostridia bacterium]|nr:PLP-dependent aminotransferase family protein [Clostridia bacterium]